MKVVWLRHYPAFHTQIPAARHHLIHKRAPMPNEAIKDSTTSARLHVTALILQL
uniref:Uncharacterized protein n=1 Tax=Anguilla anguilla TaxID=7936 RepID=A0A0E9PMG6_ANGAN